MSGVGVLVYVRGGYMSNIVKLDHVIHCYIATIFFLFAILIFHLQESELNRYVLDGKFALAWEMLFPRCLGHLSAT